MIVDGHDRRVALKRTISAARPRLGGRRRTDTRQLSIPVDFGKLQRISTSDRRIALARLIRLQLEAAGVAAKERADDER